MYKLEEKKSNGKGSNEMVALNTGIVRSYGIQSALKLIRLHPIGAPISDNNSNSH